MTIVINGTTGISGVDGSSATPAMQGADSNTGISYGTDTVTINTGGIARVTTDSSGNVGIGTASPSVPLDVVGAIKASGSVTSANDFIGGGAAGYAALYGDAAGGLIINRGSSAGNQIEFLTNSAERMRIDSSGNVGIGTSIPSAKFSVNGSVDAGPGSVSSVAYGFYPAGTYGSTGMFAPAANTVAFATSGGERMRIDSSGNLLVGTTSVYANAKVTFDSKTASYPALAVFKTVTGDTGTPGIVVSKFDNVATTSQVLVQFLYNNGSNGLGQINGNGGSQAAFGSYSDARLKENITDLPTQLEKICALRPVEFDYKDGSGHQIGFIAQEIQEVYPDAVGVGHNEMLTVTGWNKTEAYLVKAIQELKAEFDAYKATHP